MDLDDTALTGIVCEVFERARLDYDRSGTTTEVSLTVDGWEARCACLVCKGVFICSVPIAEVARADLHRCIDCNADLVDRPYFFIADPIDEDRAWLALAIKFSINERSTPTFDDLWPRILGAIASLHAASRTFLEQVADDESCPVEQG